MPRRAKPRPFLARFVPNSKRGPRWEVKQGPRWLAAKQVTFNAGAMFSTPEGEIGGEGIVRCVARGHLVINA